MTAADWPIIKQLAQIMGIIMRGLYIIVSSLGINNITICIFLFVFITKGLIMPYTYKAQKHAILAPKLIDFRKKLSDKYKNRTDNPLAKNKFNIDNGYLLNKYNIDTSKGCLMTLVQIPILFALYAIIQDVPRFVPEINNLTAEQLNSAYEIFSISIQNKPVFSFSDITILFPILTSLLQLVEMIQTSLMTKVANNGKVQGGIMNAVSLVLTFYFSTQLPIICSVYWISRSTATIIITFIMQRIISSKDLLYFEKKGIEKKNKKRKKYGLPQLSVAEME